MPRAKLTVLYLLCSGRRTRLTLLAGVEVVYSLSESTVGRLDNSKPPPIVVSISPAGRQWNAQHRPEMREQCDTPPSRLQAGLRREPQARCRSGCRSSKYIDCYHCAGAVRPKW